MDLQIPGLDRGALVAAFAGAVAYLCTQDKLPAMRALGYVTAGGVAAAYIGPGIVEVLADYWHIVLGERSRYALIFITGVGGIWMLHLIVSILQAFSARAGDFVGKLIERVFGSKLDAPKPPKIIDDEPSTKGQ